MYINFLRQTWQAKAEVSSYILQAVWGICLRCCSLFSISQPCCCIPSDQAGNWGFGLSPLRDTWRKILLCVSSWRGQAELPDEEGWCDCLKQWEEGCTHWPVRLWGAGSSVPGFDLVWKVWLQAAELWSSSVARAVACVRPFLISVLTWCVMFWRQWFYTDALRWWVKCSDIYILPQAPRSIVFLYFLGEKEESGKCAGGCCFDWCTQALKIINLGGLPEIFCLFFFNSLSSQLLCRQVEKCRKMKCKMWPLPLSQQQCWVSGECGLRAAAFPVVAWGSSIPKCVLSCMRAQSSYLKQ